MILRVQNQRHQLAGKVTADQELSFLWICLEFARTFAGLARTFAGLARTFAGLPGGLGFA